MHDIGMAIDYLHHMDIAHRDVKVLRDNDTFSSQTGAALLSDAAEEGVPAAVILWTPFMEQMSKLDASKNK